MNRFSRNGKSPKLKSKKETLDDAISANMAAAVERVVRAGGALLRCIETLAVQEAHCDGDEKRGLRILQRALKAPAREIAKSSSAVGGVVVARVLEGKASLGFEPHAMNTSNTSI
ncbi:hypothetical protein WOC76_22200 [Methylocystis sp. IM3]|uniref:hypothetical protein n=1 Tax=unclassified Methylocystis TaxID=2625913 RepID=UPI0030F6E058